MTLVRLARVVDRVRHHARRPLARTPYAWDAAMHVRPSKRVTLARPTTAVVIEGFPRSGNTFSVAAFIFANGPHCHLARHLHAPAHILRGVRLRLPVVVLIRQPRDAVLSYLVRRPTLTASDALIEYLDFYETVWKVRDGFVVATFDAVIADFGGVLDRVNKRFGTGFVRYLPTDENNAACFAIVEEMNREECRGSLVETHVGRPSVHRQRRTMELQALLRQPRAATRLRRAEALYEQYSLR